MEELIKEADEMYDKLMRVIRHINTPEFDKDDSIAIIEASQLLRRLVERKDNIVDLSEVFHNAAEVPNMRRDLLYDSRFCGYGVLKTMLLCEEEWSYFKRTYGIKRWAYLKNLLPKGGKR